MSHNRAWAGQIVTARAREVVSKYLQLAVTPEDLFDKLGPISNELETLGLEAIPALAEGLKYARPRRQVMAAWSIYVIAKERADANIDRRLKSEATQIIVDALQGGTPEDRAFPYALMTTGYVPDEAVDVLRKTLTDADETLRVYAAVALTHCGEEALLALPVLRSALFHEKEGLAAIAASAYGRLQLRPDAIESLKSAFPLVAPACQFIILQSLKQIGPFARTVAPTLDHFIDEPKNPSYLRGTAVTAWASIMRDADDLLPMLSKALRSPDWQVVEGAIDGCILVGRFPADAAKILASRLSADAENMRGTSALGLMQMGRKAAPAVKALIERASLESSLKVCEAMVAAIAAIGAVAIPRLIDLLKQDDIHKIEIAASALVAIGSDAAVPIAELLRSESDDQFRTRAFQLLRHLGPKAVPAIAILGSILDETGDEEVAGYCLCSLFVCIPASKAAMPAVIRCLTKWDGEIFEWAVRILWSMGPEAIPAISAELELAQGDARQRLELALAGIRGTEEKRYPQFEQIGRDDLLVMFVVVGDILVKRGSASWKVIGADVKTEAETTDGAMLSFATSVRSITGNMKKLGMLLGQPLTTHKHGSKGGGGLTPGACSLLPEVKAYLAMKPRRTADS